MLDKLIETGNSKDIKIDNSSQDKSSTRLCFESSEDLKFLIAHQFEGFDDFWELPEDFIDDVNYRRGGWGAVSKLVLGEAGAERTYYVKRQENQFRYSIKKPLGALTYEHEVAAIKRNQRLNLAAVNIACWGIKKEADTTKGLLVTREIDDTNLGDMIASNPDWSALEPILLQSGLQLMEMHKHAIQQGALYPKHIYINQLTGNIQLIDFERSRKRSSVRKAIKSDLKQLVKHLAAMPDAACLALLQPYLQDHSKLVNELLEARKI